MISDSAPGARFRAALLHETPLQIVGTINAYSALLAKRIGYRAIYLSGAGVANASFGLPDLGVTTVNDVVDDIRRITQAVDLPLLVDADTGWGSFFNIQRSVREIENAGAAALHLEDQIQAKRCGHRPHKAIVSVEEMCDRIKAAVDARQNDCFAVMARTDALANEGLSAALDRSMRYIEAGADMLFPEAVQRLEDYQAFYESTQVPVLANITEFGKTPLFTSEALKNAKVAMALYPLSAFRAMSQAAIRVYEGIRKNGTQNNLTELMQTRDELYEVLNYHEYETKLDLIIKEQS